MLLLSYCFLEVVVVTAGDLEVVNVQAALSSFSKDFSDFLATLGSSSSSAELELTVPLRAMGS